MLRIAVQKSGRLTDASLKLIAECGIQVEQVGLRLRACAYNFPLEVLFLRDDDIPRYVQDGLVDLAIVGQNVLLEAQAEVRVLRPLGFGRCRLAIAVPKTFTYVGAESLRGCKIATSYPNILAEFLARKAISAEIQQISGSVELAPTMGLGDAICDLVSSGSTLLSNGLKEVECVMKSEAVLISSCNLNETLEPPLEQLLFRVNAVLRARNTKYITLNIRTESIPDIVKLLPGLKSPSVLALDLAGWSSIHTVIAEDEFWERLEQLKRAGAEGIVVLPIEKVIE